MGGIISRWSIAAATAVLLLPVSVRAVEVSDIIDQAQAKYADVDKKLKDLTITQVTRTINPKKATETGTAEMTIYKKGDRLRIETSLAVPAGQQQKDSERLNTKSVVIYDGKNTWMINPLLGKTKVANQNFAELRARQNWWDSVAKGAQVTGTAVVQGRPAYMIENKSTAAAFAKLWIDQKSLTLLQGEAVRDNAKVLMTFSDYRNVENITELPYRIDVSQNGAQVSETTVTSVKVNRDIPDSLFDAGAVKTNNSGVDSNNLMKGVTQQEQ